MENKPQTRDRKERRDDPLKDNTNEHQVHMEERSEGKAESPTRQPESKLEGQNIIYQTNSVSETTVFITQKPSTSCLGRTERFVWGSVTALVTLLVAMTFALGGERSRDWPLTPLRGNELEAALRRVSDSLGAAELAAALLNHDGDHPLSVHLVATDADADAVIAAVSATLFGSEESQRVVRMSGSAEAEEKVCDVFDRWASAIVVVRPPVQQPEWLTSALNDHWPSVCRHTSTAGGIFFLVSPSLPDGDVVEVRSKMMLKEMGYSDRICQRVRHVIEL